MPLTPLEAVSRINEEVTVEMTVRAAKNCPHRTSHVAAQAVCDPGGSGGDGVQPTGLGHQRGGAPGGVSPKDVTALNRTALRRHMTGAPVPVRHYDTKAQAEAIKILQTLPANGTPEDRWKEAERRVKAAKLPRRRCYRKPGEQQFHCNDRAEELLQRILEDMRQATTGNFHRIVVRLQREYGRQMAKV